MEGTRILVLGDGMTDVWWVGTSIRRSAEVDIPIVAIQQVIHEPGGAANVYQNLLELGADPVHGFATGPIKNRLVLDGVQISRWDVHDYCEPEPLDTDYNSPYDAIIVSDYSKGGLVLEDLSHLHGPFFIDTKRDPRLFSGLSEQCFFFPNESEFAKYRDQYLRLQHVVYKRGPLGCEYLQSGNKLASQPALCASPISTCGAGDTVVAAFTYAYLQCSSIPDSLLFASKAAAVAVSKPYTSTVTLQEINEY